MKELLAVWEYKLAWSFRSRSDIVWVVCTGRTGAAGCTGAAPEMLLARPPAEDSESLCSMSVNLSGLSGSENDGAGQVVTLAAMVQRPSGACQAPAEAFCLSLCLCPWAVKSRQKPYMTSWWR